MNPTKYGRLTPIGPADHPEHGKQHIKCLRCVCDCGTVGVYRVSNLKSGKVKSCGCYRREWAANKARTHGLTGTPEWGVWAAMKRRCQNPNTKDYALYGGRGIKVCDAWQKFSGFLRDMGNRPSDSHTLERIDYNGDYCPENCRWATQKEQQNNRRSNAFFESAGERLTLQQWAERLGVRPGLLRYHLVYKGLTIEQAAEWFRSRRQEGVSYVKVA